MKPCRVCELIDGDDTLKDVLYCPVCQAWMCTPCRASIGRRALAAILERGMVRAGRLARIRVAARDTPGVLARITSIVGEAGANIDEVHHQRAFTTLSAQNVEVELVVQTRGPEHIQAVLAQLNAAGFEAQLV